MQWGPLQMNRSELDGLKRHTLIGTFPRLTRFYGISPLELADTPNWVLQLYVDCISELEAEERILAMQVSDWSHLSEKDRRSIRSRLIERLNTEPVAPPTMNVTEHASKRDLAAIGIKVVIESDA